MRDAAVLVFTHEPQEHDARSVFAGRDLTPMAAVSQKAREARERGARLLMVIEDPSHTEDRATRATWWTDPQSDTMGHPRAARRARPGERCHARTRPGRRGRRSSIARYARSRGASESIRVSYVEHRAQFTARLRNIVGVLRGSDPVLAREAVVVGAHYDHIGPGASLVGGSGGHRTGPQRRRRQCLRRPALIEMARAAVRSRARFRRSVVFAAFAGEELGLRGSEHYVARPSRRAQSHASHGQPGHGRPRTGSRDGRHLRRAEPVAAPARLRPWTSLLVQDFSRGGYDADASDVAPFVRRGVPAIAFFTGFHADYHRPSDDWAAVDAEGGAAIAGLALRLVEELCRQNASAGR